MVSVDSLGAASESEVEAVRRGMEVGDTVPALRLVTALAVVSLAIGSLGLATSLVITSSGQRDVRGDVTRDRQRCRCTRTRRECCRAALGIWGLCFQCPLKR
jgi:hypothetical protein